MKTFGYVVSALISCSLCLGQNVGKVESNPPSGGSSTGVEQKVELSRQVVGNALTDNSCAFTFTSGSGNSSLQYCVSANGNIPEIQAPVGHSLISLDRGEGYGICDATNLNGLVRYDDYSTFGDSGNLGTAIVLSHTATSVKIARTTTDGIWTLIQTFTQLLPSSSAKIAMTLKNNTAAARIAIVVRYADVDVDGTTFNNFDGTSSSAFGWSSSNVNARNRFGLLLQDAGTGTLDGTEIVGAPQNDFHPPDPCSVSIPGLLVSVDGSLVLLYEVPVPARGSKTVTMTYKGM